MTPRARTLRVATFGGHFKLTPTSQPPSFVSPSSFCPFIPPSPPALLPGSLSAPSQVASPLRCWLQGSLLVVVSRRLPGLNGKSHVQVAVLSFRSLDHTGGQVQWSVCSENGKDIQRVGAQRIRGTLDFLEIPTCSVKGGLRLGADGLPLGVALYHVASLMSTRSCVSMKYVSYRVF